MGFPIIGKKNPTANQIIKEQGKEENQFIEDMAKAMEDLFAEKGVKNYQIEPILKIFTNRHTQRVMNMRLDDEILQMKNYEYQKYQE